MLILWPVWVTPNGRNARKAMGDYSLFISLGREERRRIAKGRAKPMRKHDFIWRPVKLKDEVTFLMFLLHTFVCEEKAVNKLFKEEMP